MINLNENYRKVEREKALEFVMKYNLSYWGECSAKENTNISDIFTSFYNSNSKITLGVYFCQKDKLLKKTIGLNKMLDLKKREPKINCCF